MKYLVIPSDPSYSRVKEIDCCEVTHCSNGTIMFSDGDGEIIRMINNSAWRECYVVPEDSQ